ncbi:hypothetical protein ACF09K_08430 [Streptomyces sp. NPDC014882]|uniref:hypothetical protein n=1 Tax=Streptomyces sp. NPDC014882 TaxID=3364927 RepID=UPI0036FFDF71
MGDRVEVVPFPERFGTEDELASVITGFDRVITLRERVAFPASLLNRLPRLRLPVASGTRHPVIDHAAARADGVTVCGTESSSTPPGNHPLRTAPRLLATPHLGYVSRADYARHYGQAAEDVQACLAEAPVRVPG